MEFINETCLTAEFRSAAVHDALACALLQQQPLQWMYRPTQITKPVKVAQTKLVLGAGTRSGFSLASCNCPKYSKFKHQQDFFLMYADPRSIFTAAWLFRIRAVHYCIICPYLGRELGILTLLTASRCTRDDMNCRWKDNSDIDVRYFRINKEKSLIFSQDICGSEQNILVLSGAEVGDPAHLLRSKTLTLDSANQRPGWLGLGQSEASQQIWAQW